MTKTLRKISYEELQDLIEKSKNGKLIIKDDVKMMKITFVDGVCEITPLDMDEIELKIISKQVLKKRIAIFSVKMLAYMFRWQLSTLVMTPVMLGARKYFGITNYWELIFWANLLGAVPFYFIDKFIFVHLGAYAVRAAIFVRSKLSRAAIFARQAFSRAI